MRKLNIGSHNKKLKGYVNVDALDLPNVDIVHDLTEYPYPFESESIDEIVMVEVLEHISFRDTKNVLKELYRIMKDGAKLHIQVPDIEAMIRCYYEKRICPCIPHKPSSAEDVKPRNDCMKCNGKGRVHPDRWLYSFLGAQKHDYDTHKNIFTKDILKGYLYEVGFSDFDFSKDEYGWKIKCNIYK